jgi:hypothetical protein
MGVKSWLPGSVGRLLGAAYDNEPLAQLLLLLLLLLTLKVSAAGTTTEPLLQDHSGPQLKLNARAAGARMGASQLSSQPPAWASPGGPLPPSTQPSPQASAGARQSSLAPPLLALLSGLLARTAVDDAAAGQQHSWGSGLVRAPTFSLGLQVLTQRAILATHASKGLTAAAAASAVAGSGPTGDTPRGGSRRLGLRLALGGASLEVGSVSVEVGR